jgi:hypothetical protein
MTLGQRTRIVVAVSCGLLVALGARAADKDNGKTIPAGAKVYITPSDGFETNLRAALEAKQVPLTVVDDKAKADYEIVSHAQTQKAGAAKKILMGSWHSKEEASIQVNDLKSGDVVFAYAYHADNSAHGRKSSAESCAKHLKERVK